MLERRLASSRPWHHCLWAGWPAPLGLVQLEHSRGLSYDLLSPNLPSSALTVPPRAVKAETTGLGRLCEAALIEAHLLRGKKKMGLKRRGWFVV